jgi:membrane protease YdiL (CAAX protease family)
MTDDSLTRNRSRAPLIGLLVFGILPLYVNGWYNPILATDPARFWVVDIVTWTIPPTFIYLIDGWLIQACHHLPLEPTATGAFEYRNMLPPPGPASGVWRLLAVAYLAISAGLVEEFYYRGLMRLLFGRRVAGTILFVLISSLVFAGSHWEWGELKLFYTFVWGVIFAMVYIATGNLWPGIIGHAAVDAWWIS